jgi:hypothetical protein
MTEKQQVILVAVSVVGDDLSMTQAQEAAARLLPRPGTGVIDKGRLVAVESWWIAEDDRVDGSDNDSAVFVSPGRQQAAYQLLHDTGLTPDCNDPGFERGDREVRGQFEVA